MYAGRLCSERKYDPKEEAEARRLRKMSEEERAAEEERIRREKQRKEAKRRKNRMAPPKRKVKMVCHVAFTFFLFVRM